MFSTDNFLDRESIKKKLVEVENARALSRDSMSFQLSNLENTRSFVAKQSPPPARLRISYRESGTEQDYVEANFRLQGVLVSKDLPPVNQIRNANRAKMYLSQSVQLCGFGSDRFDAAMTAATDHFHTLAAGRRIGPDEIWQPSVFEGHLALDCANRYYTSTTFAQASQSVPFEALVDPNNILKGLQDDKFIHTDDNEVDYIKLELCDGQETRATRISPSTFRLGDIVEVTITLASFSTNGAFRMSSVLRSLALIDSTDRQRADLARVKSVANNYISLRTTKRKAAYVVLEEEIISQKKFAAGLMDNSADEMTEAEGRMEGLQLN